MIVFDPKPRVGFPELPLTYHESRKALCSPTADRLYSCFRLGCIEMCSNFVANIH